SGRVSSSSVGAAPSATSSTTRSWRPASAPATANGPNRSSPPVSPAGRITTGSTGGVPGRLPDSPRRGLRPLPAPPLASLDEDDRRAGKAVAARAAPAAHLLQQRPQALAFGRRRAPVLQAVEDSQLEVRHPPAGLEGQERPPRRHRDHRDAREAAIGGG